MVLNRKLLTKALFQDEKKFLSNYEYRQQTYRLADLLDYGWEMDYDSTHFADRLAPYETYGLLTSNLYLGISTLNKADKAAAIFVKDHGYGGLMVYNVHNSSAVRYFLTRFSKALYGADIIMNCVQTEEENKR